MLNERTVVGKIEILEDGQIQLRTDTVIDRDGVEVSRQFHRKVLEPGQDTSLESARVQAITPVVWTPEVIDAYRRRRAAQQPVIIIDSEVDRGR